MRRLALILSLVLLLVAALAWWRMSRPQTAPHVFLIVIDTLRSDHLGVHGYHRPITPNLDRFAGSAAVYDRVWAQSSWTKTSIASLLTGVYPPQHGVLEEFGAGSVLPEAAVTLAEIFKEHGYHTVAVSGNPHIAPVFGFDQGFESFSFVDSWTPNTTIPTTVQVFDALSQLPRYAKQFTYIHYLDPHDPWENAVACDRFTRGLAVDRQAVINGAGWELAGEAAIREELDTGRLPTPQDLSAEELAYLTALYDCEIERVDAAIGRILDHLQETGVLDRSIVAITSDHGEEFLEHGMLLHGYQLHEETVRVPLLVRVPGMTDKGWRSATSVELLDLFPTLLHLAGLAGFVPQVDGRVLPGLGGETGDGVSLGVTVFRKRDLAFLAKGDDKLIWDGRREEGWLYDLAADPGETKPQTAMSPRGMELRKEMQRRLQRSETLAYPRQDIGPEVSKELRRQLRALGYVE